MYVNDKLICSHNSQNKVTSCLIQILLLLHSLSLHVHTIAFIQLHVC
jgi:hypothetical protein